MPKILNLDLKDGSILSKKNKSQILYLISNKSFSILPKKNKYQENTFPNFSFTLLTFVLSTLYRATDSQETSIHLKI